MAPGMCCMHRCPLLVLQHALCCNAASHLGCVRVPICATMASHASAAPSYWLALPGHPSTFRGAPAQQPTAASGEAASARAAPRLTAELCGRRGLGDLQQHGMAWHPQPQTHTHRGASTRTARTEASAAEAARPTAPSLCVYGGGGGGGHVVPLMASCEMGRQLWRTRHACTALSGAWHGGWYSAGERSHRSTIACTTTQPTAQDRPGGCSRASDPIMAWHGMGAERTHARTVAAAAVCMCVCA